MARTDRSSRTIPPQSPPRDTIAALDRVYDLRRNCLLNELYYGRRLRQYGTLSFWLEVLIVIGSGASGVSGWVIWTTYPELKSVWAVIAGLATLLAALKPVFSLDKRVQRYNRLFSGYRVLSASMADVAQLIRESHGLSEPVSKEVSRIKARYDTLAADDDPSPPSKLILKLQDDVNRRVPASSLFYPGPDGAPVRQDAPEDGLSSMVASLETKVEPVQSWPGKQGGSAHAG